MKAKSILKKLNYLPRWAWYLASLSIGGPIGPLFVYLGFHALEKMAKDQAEEEAAAGWNAHVNRRASGGSSSVYQDEECTVTSDEDVRSQWQRTESSARAASAAHTRRAAVPDDQDAAYTAHEETADDEPTLTGDIADVVREGRDALRRIRRANDLIPDPALSAQIDSIENSCGQILGLLEQRPQLLTQLRTFLRYYLPTTLKLLDARAKLERTANTPKARQVRARISEALGVIDEAFKKQLEALDEYRFIDLESEMDVLRDMLRADGLVGEEKEDDDPFSSVMKRRSEGGPGTPMQTH